MAVMVKGLKNGRVAEIRIISVVAANQTVNLTGSSHTVVGFKSENSRLKSSDGGRGQDARLIQLP